MALLAREAESERIMPFSPLLLAATFALCSSSPRVTCVVDGDTFWLDGEKIRIADINTPETHQPGCADEKAQGDKATVRLIALLNAGRFELLAGRRDRDRYGRLLRVVSRGGQSLGDVLVSEGLAEPWTGRRGNWCPSQLTRR
ncbi:MAG: thermonuclease family protein [Sphingomonadaceae bacterium]|nr:thermonuclease family protein [Sphingomonadaceae bacterium]